MTDKAGVLYVPSIEIIPVTESSVEDRISEARPPHMTNVTFY
jgi:hypothetical protein